MRQDYIHLIRKILFFGIGVYTAVSVISWLFTWLVVANSYCSYNPSERECRLPLYPKWEYQSLLYSEEFRGSIQEALAAGCLTEEPLSIKVMQYRQDAALVWYRGKSGSTWLARFYRSQGSIKWKMYSPIDNSGEKVCHVDVIYNRLGGSSDNYYWYN